jgi:hypothetical protein
VFVHRSMRQTSEGCRVPWLCAQQGRAALYILAQGQTMVVVVLALSLSLSLLLSLI